MHILSLVIVMFTLFSLYGEVRRLPGAALVCVFVCECLSFVCECLSCLCVSVELCVCV